MRNTEVPAAGISNGAGPNGDLLLAFAPLDKAAFGAAIGVAAALLVAGLTTVTVLQLPENRLPLQLLHVYFRGYAISWPGVFVGAGWAGFVGFVFGWFVAFCRNLMMAISLFVIRSRAEMAQARDFLDHV